MFDIFDPGAARNRRFDSLEHHYHSKGGEPLKVSVEMTYKPVSIDRSCMDGPLFKLQILFDDAVVKLVMPHMRRMKISP